MKYIAEIFLKTLQLTPLTCQKCHGYLIDQGDGLTIPLRKQYVWVVRDIS